VASAPQARTQPSPQASKPKSERTAKSNVRNARSGEGSPSSAAGGSRSEREGKRSRGGDPSTVESSRVYVGNLSYDVTEQDLKELLKGVGNVRQVEIVYNRSTHRSKGYGFVEMLAKEDAVRAVEVLNDQHFMGRRLLVSGAKSKGMDERDDREEAPERSPRPVVVAPLPEKTAADAAAGEPVAEVSGEGGEPKSQVA
jgi:RNA recognition motif-containing protein